MNGNVNNSNIALPDNGVSVSPVSVLTKYAPLVKSRAMYFKSPNLELDDIIQEGNIGLFTASLRYNSKVATFATFARKCIDSAIIDYLRKNQKLSSVPNELLVDIDELEIADVAFSPEVFMSQKEEYKIFVCKAKSALSDFEYSVFSLLLQGLSQGEMSEKIGVDIKVIRNAVQRIRTKLK